MMISGVVPTMTSMTYQTHFNQTTKTLYFTQIWGWGVTDEEKSHAYYQLYTRVSELFTMVHMHIPDYPSNLVAEMCNSTKQKNMVWRLDGVKREFWEKVMEPHIAALKSEREVKTQWVTRGKPRKMEKVLLQILLPVNPGEAMLFQRMCSCGLIDTDAIEWEPIESSSDGYKNYSSLPNSGSSGFHAKNPRNLSGSFRPYPRNSGRR